MGFVESLISSSSATRRSELGGVVGESRNTRQDSCSCDDKATIGLSVVADDLGPCFLENGSPEGSVGGVLSEVEHPVAGGIDSIVPQKLVVNSDDPRLASNVESNGVDTCSILCFRQENARNEIWELGDSR